MAQQQPFPTLDAPLVDPQTGTISLIWSRFFLSMWTRTGSATGNDSTSFPYPSSTGDSGQVLTSQGNAPSIWTTVRTKLSQFANDAGFITAASLEGLQSEDQTQTQIQTFYTANLANTAPRPDATNAQAGQSLQASRADHVHPREANPRYASVGVGAVTWTAGTGAPGSVQPNGSVYSRTDGTLGNRLYVSDGAVWRAVAAV
jgi:hypothetical protein